MRQAFSVALLQFQLILKSKGTVMTMFGLPLLMTLIFGSLAGGDSNGVKVYPVAVVDQDSSFAAQRLVEALQHEPALQVQTASAEALPKLLSDKRISAGVIIPAGFQRGLAGGTVPEVQLMTAPGGNLGVAIGPAVQRLAAQVTSDYRLARQAPGAASDEAQLAVAYAKAGADRLALGATVVQETVRRSGPKSDSDLGNVGERALGFTVMFVMMIVFLMGGVILKERQDGTWGRLLTTPASKLSLLTGYVLSFFITGMFQFAVLVGASSLLFRVKWGPLLPLTVMAAAFVLCSAGLGLFMAGIVRTAEQQSTLGILLVTATSMLGGVYWPLQFVGDTMRRIGYLTPQAWAMDGFREVMLRGGDWGALVWPLTVLLALGAIFTAGGLQRVRYE